MVNVFARMASQEFLVLKKVAPLIATIMDIVMMEFVYASQDLLKMIAVFKLAPMTAHQF